MAVNNLFMAYERYNINPNKKKTEETKPESNGAGIKKMNMGLKNSVSSQYLENKVLTASPEELTLMLYDGAVRYANKAVLHIEEGDAQEAHNAIIRTQDIYLELMVSLNKDYEVSDGLYKMYDYIYHRLIDANLDKDIDILNEIISYSREFRDTWVQAMKLARQKSKNEMNE